MKVTESAIWHRARNLDLIGVKVKGRLHYSEEQQQKLLDYLDQNTALIAKRKLLIYDFKLQNELMSNEEIAMSLGVGVKLVISALLNDILVVPSKMNYLD